MNSFQNLLQLPPLSLYVHIPWCIRKCPYCDFNSHPAGQALPIDAYIDCLLDDLRQDARFAQGRALQSLFFGGGTPSLMPAKGMARLLAGINALVPFASQCEITLEANPGTAEYDNFAGYREAGVNRLSLGAQSFNAQHLQRLGRIHTTHEIEHAFQLARQAGFDNINLDLMFGLPNQTRAQAMDDLQQAFQLGPEHLSWYQLTIEKNTAFYSAPPVLPDDDHVWSMQQAGRQLMAEQGFSAYEISAWCQDKQTSRHNLNYWQFGDYLAIGAGAHGKITLPAEQKILRLQKTRMPEHYLNARQTGNYSAKTTRVASAELPFEFMMNSLRLSNGVPRAWYTARTGLPLQTIAAPLQRLQAEGLMETDTERICASERGRQFLNHLLESFLAT